MYCTLWSPYETIKLFIFECDSYPNIFVHGIELQKTEERHFYKIFTGKEGHISLRVINTWFSENDQNIPIKSVVLGHGIELQKKSEERHFKPVISTKKWFNLIVKKWHISLRVVNTWFSENNQNLTDKNCRIRPRVSWKKTFSEIFFADTSSLNTWYWNWEKSFCL